jgi:hypothetical protein
MTNEGSACHACPAGYTCPRTGMVKAQECGQGSYQVLPGHALISCSLCETGKYNEKITNATSDNACESCPEGSTTLSQGAKSSTECIGKFSPVLTNIMYTFDRPWTHYFCFQYLLLAQQF